MTFVNVKHVNKAAPFVMFGMAVMFASYSGQSTATAAPDVCQPTTITIGASGTIATLGSSGTQVEIICP